MKTSDFHYDLLPELIAQQPLPFRGQSRMMIVNRSSGAIEHGRISDLPKWLNAGDLLVVNNTRVIPARLFGHKETGGRVEVLLIEEKKKDVWEAFVRSRRAPEPGAALSLAGGMIRARAIGRLEKGRAMLRLEHDRPLFDILDEEGVAPLPPYIKRPKPGAGSFSPAAIALDKERYQTVYAKKPGAIAAPTAGLHFNSELLERLRRRGVRRTAITLHVGPGTFTPVRTEHVEQHAMEPERYIVPPAAARRITETRQAGGSVVAVGTTVVRALETAAPAHGAMAPARGRSSLFIFPPYSFKAVDIMLTNLHLPESTLIMMVSAFAGIELIKRAYAIAIEERYRFYSYGDCMLIL